MVQMHVCFDDMLHVSISDVIVTHSKLQDYSLQQVVGN